jgi:NAD+ diphosphatase
LNDNDAAWGGNDVKIVHPPEMMMSLFPEPSPRPALGYTANKLDRAVPRRSEQAALAALAANKDARVYVIGGELVVLKRHDGVLDPLFVEADARALGPTREAVFLGLADGVARFALGMDHTVAEALKTRGDLAVSDLRSIAVQGLVDADHLPPLAEAKALLSWHTRHRFCSVCGSASDPVDAGWRRKCPACGADHFPRTDPVVIMLAIDGDQCLLGRQSRFAPGMWSCLAGFVEPGESLEEAVRRETREETGIECGRVGYFASQPWPFPMSLMIGCYAQALSTDLVIDHSELEAARWFDRASVAKMLVKQHPDGISAPPPVAIAHHIIRTWVDGGASVWR